MTEKDPGSQPFLGKDFPEGVFKEVCSLLLTGRGFDLAGYKDTCIKRRIAARVRALGFRDPKSYLALLRRKPEEIDALVEALTIHVSQFFRNPSVFAYLEERVLPDILRRAAAAGRQEILLWSVGCAGGEEAFSLALLADALAAGNLHIDILGTDVSAAALEQARQGVFHPQRLGGVPPQMLERYFTREGNFYRIHRTIRQRVRFVEHDILAGGPYPAADLILCRNVLIYFSGAKQEKIQRRFAAALSPGGVLVLGRAETLMGTSRQLYAVDSSTERVYRCRDSSGPQ